MQEGWDNPNIFTLCKLASTDKETSRRQQVGRGLRIAVDQDGRRQTYNKLEENDTTFRDINTLDVIVSEREKEFIQEIQQEIQQASFSFVGDTLHFEQLKQLGLSDTESAILYVSFIQNGIVKDEKIVSSIHAFLKHNRDKIAIPNLTDERYQEILKMFLDNRIPIRDGNKPQEEVTIREQKWNVFQELWEAINRKSEIVYKDIKEDEIIAAVSETFNKEYIQPIQVMLYTQTYNAQKDTIETQQEKKVATVNFLKTQKFTDFITHFIKDEKLPLPFMLNLLNNIDRTKIQHNPQKAKNRLLEIIKETIHSKIIQKVSYTFNETSIYPNSLQQNKETHLQNIKATVLGNYYTQENVLDHLLYDTICYDSDIEKTDQQDCPKKINGYDITVFAKLPKISIPTPYKTYSPDFAYLLETQNEKKIFLVVETKGYDNENDIPQKEKKKIKYAEIFFSSLQKEFPNIDIRYKTRINKQALSELLQDISHDR